MNAHKLRYKTFTNFLQLLAVLLVISHSVTGGDIRLRKKISPEPGYKLQLGFKPGRIQKSYWGGQYDCWGGKDYFRMGSFALRYLGRGGGTLL